MKQVDKKAYQFSSYAHIERFASYYYQLKKIFECDPKNILEVGVGDGVVRDYIKGNTTIEYTSVDIAHDLNPDVVGSVTTLPFRGETFDVVCAFEVLEHLPFEQFERALSELARVSRRSVILSLPHFGPPVYFSLKIPFFRTILIYFKIPFPKKHIFNGQHYWEIGKKGYSPRYIKKLLQQYFIVKSDFVPFESLYHHFYVLEIKNKL